MNPATASFLVGGAYEMAMEGADIRQAVVSGGQLAVSSTLSGAGVISAFGLLDGFPSIGNIHPAFAITAGLIYSGLNEATGVSPGGFVDNVVKGALLTAGSQVVQSMGQSGALQPVAGSMNTVV